MIERIFDMLFNRSKSDQTGIDRKLQQGAGLLALMYFLSMWVIRPSRSSSNGKGTAVCYSRLSYAKYRDDEISPKRQRDLNTTYCESNGYTAEHYADIKGHSSGRNVDNRPGWLALEERLKDPDVTALVAHDLARLHRKGWRIGKLLEMLEEYDVDLILSDPERTIDTSTWQGKFFIMFVALADEYYAEDAAMRANSSVRWRKSRNITVGMPPFGTVRDDTGRLLKTLQGAWLLDTGEWVGVDFPDDESKPPNAVLWRGYGDAMFRTLRLYATAQYGYGTLAEMLDDEGWAFKDPTYGPRHFKVSSVRQIVANIYTYGGILQNARQKT